MITSKLMKYMLLVAFVAVLASSCSKSDAVNHSDTSKNTVTTWLTQQFERMGKSEKLSLLTNNLDFDKSHSEKLTDTTSLIIIPVSSDYEINKNIKTGDKNILLLTTDKDGQILRGKFAMITATSGLLSADKLDGAFSQIYTSSTSKIDGTFTFLTLSGTPIYGLSFSKGKLASLSRYKQTKDEKASTRSSLITANCIAFYLVTTYYYDDGTTYVEEEYLYTICPSTGGEEPGGGGGGSEPDPSCCIVDQNFVFNSSPVSQNLGTNISEELDPSVGMIRIVQYTWAFHNNGILSWTWKNISHDKAILDYDINQWKFRTIEHEAVSLLGTTPPCVNTTCTVNSALGTIDGDKLGAQMQLNYTVSMDGRACAPQAAVLYTMYNSSKRWNAN